MVAIVPIRYRTTDTNSSSNGEEYFFNRVITENSSVYRKVGISQETIENMTKIIDVEMKGLTEKLSEMLTDPDSLRNLLPDTGRLERVIKSSAKDDIFLYDKDPKSLILRTDANAFILISKNIDAAKTFLATLDADFQQINNITKDFGLDYRGFIIGEDYAKESLPMQKANIKTYKLKPSKNAFEDEVIKFVSEITDCQLKNIEIEFEKPNEVFEYDLLIPFADDIMVDIEVKDYTTLKDMTREDADTLKSKLILSPSDKAKRLDAKVIVIAKGFPPTIFDQMKEFAVSRNILLLNENNYKKEVETVIMKEGIRSLDEYSRETRYGRRVITRSGRRIVLPSSAAYEFE